MKIPVGTLLQIVAYRGFHDVPRVVLAMGEGPAFWILDSPFDDQMDEYRSDYAVCYAGRDAAAAAMAFERHGSGDAGDCVEMLALSRFEFDPGRRSTFRIMD